MLQGWLLYIELIHFSVHLQFQSLLWVILHDQLLIVVSKIKPDVSHFRVFGCEAWAHIPYEKRKALQPKSEKCIFVGYFGDVKGYRIIQPHSHDIIIRRDVKFDENLLACEPNLAGVPFLACKPDWWMCILLLLPASLTGFQLQFLMMTVRMKIHLHLPMFLQLHQHQYFLDGSIQHVKQLVILSMILEINDEH